MAEKVPLSKEEFNEKFETGKKVSGLLLLNKEDDTYLFSPCPDTFPYMIFPKDLIKSIDWHTDLNLFHSGKWNKVAHVSVEVKEPTNDDALFFYNLLFNFMSHAAVKMTQMNNALKTAAFARTQAIAPTLQLDDPKCGCPNNCLGDCHGGQCQPSVPFKLGCV